MANVCKGLCRAHSTKRNANYKKGEKRCTICEIVLRTEAVRCHCCHIKLRSNRHGGRERKIQLLNAPRY